ncbi:hypothetical protein [Ignatzschineria sp. LJL83]
MSFKEPALQVDNFSWYGMLKDSWKSTTGFKQPIALSLIYIIVILNIGIVFMALGRSVFSLISFFGILIYCNASLNVAMSKLALRHLREEPIDWKWDFISFLFQMPFLKFLLTSLLFIVFYITLGIALFWVISLENSMLSICAIILSMIIFFYCMTAYSFVFHILNDRHHIGIFSALKLSRKLVMPRLWKILTLYLTVLFAIVIISIVIYILLTIVIIGLYPHFIQGLSSIEASFISWIPQIWILISFICCHYLVS